MARKLSEENKLYFYQLIATHYGIGKQVFLPKIEELFKEDNIFPEDLGFDDFRALLEACSDIINLTDFKGNRSYATLVQDQRFDDALAQAQSDSTPAKGGGKPWKHRKAAILKPQKPKQARQKKTAEKKSEAKLEEQPKPAKAEASKQPETKAEIPQQSEESQPTEPEPQETEPKSEAPEAPAAETAEVEGVQVTAEITKPQSEPATEASEQSEQEPEPKPEPEAKSEPVKAEAADKEKEEETSQTQKLGKDRVFTLDEILAMPSESQKKPEEGPAESQEEASEEGKDALPAEVPDYIVHKAPTSHSLKEQDLKEQKRIEKAPTTAEPRVSSSLPTSFLRGVHCKDELLNMVSQLMPIDYNLLQVLEEDWQAARAAGTIEGTRSRVSFPLRFLHEDGTTQIRLTIQRSVQPISGKHWYLALVDGNDGTHPLKQDFGLEGMPESNQGAWTALQTTPNPHAKSPQQRFTEFASFEGWDTMLSNLSDMAEDESWYATALKTPDTVYPMLREYLTTTFVRLMVEHKVLENPDHDFAAFNTGLVTDQEEPIYACFTAGGAGPDPYQLSGFCTADEGELGKKFVRTLNPLPEQASYLSAIEEVQPRSDVHLTVNYRTLLLAELDRLPQDFVAPFLRDEKVSLALEESCAAGISGQQRAQDVQTVREYICDTPDVFNQLRDALADPMKKSWHRAKRNYRLVLPVYDPIANTVEMLLPVSLEDNTKVATCVHIEKKGSTTYQATGIVSLPEAACLGRIVNPELPAWLK